ncbi:MAG: acyl-ACP--UDP-N-acetylglucosamine O-acyltransferase [Prevotella sp.]|jgi:UDP-N-acetylglucosamine acyltransferase
MANHISDKAVVDPKAQIGDNVTIYPFSYIEGDVVIGDNCVIAPNVNVLNGTRMGNDCKVFQNTVLGAMPQDFHFKGDKTELIIGDKVIIRENVVINRATFAGGQTVIGRKCFLMEGAHVAHDTKLGSHCVLGFGTKIAGDCVVGDGVVFSANVIANPKVRVGDKAMIIAGTTFSKDIPPFILAGGTPVKYCGINSVLLEYLGVDKKIQDHIANAYRLVFHGQTSVFDAVLQIKEQVPDSPEIQNIINFIKGTQLGIISKM